MKERKNDLCGYLLAHACTYRGCSGLCCPFAYHVAYGATSWTTSVDEGAEEMNKPNLSEVASELLCDIDGVDAVFLDDTTVYVLACEHGHCNREALVRAEDTLCRMFGDQYQITVRAHQGRDFDQVLPGLRRIA